MSLRLDGAMYMHMHTCTQVGRLHLLTFSNCETSALLSRGYRMIWWLNCLKTQKELEETRRIITAHYVQVSILSIIFFQVLTSLWGRCYSPLYRWGNWGSGKRKLGAGPWLRCPSTPMLGSFCHTKYRMQSNSVNSVYCKFPLCLAASLLRASD